MKNMIPDHVAENGNLETLKLLLARTNVSTIIGGRSLKFALIDAVKHNHPDMVEYLDTNYHKKLCRHYPTLFVVSVNTGADASRFRIMLILLKRIGIEGFKARDRQTWFTQIGEYLDKHADIEHAEELKALVKENLVRYEHERS